MKKGTILVFLFVTFGYSQRNQTPKDALATSKEYRERARWFLSMPQYDQDSANVYLARAIAVLNPKIDAHRNQMARFKFDQQKGNNLNLTPSGEDSLAKIRWREYHALTGQSEEIRVLKYDFLVYWANVKLLNGDSKASLDLFKKAMALIQKKDSREAHARAAMDKGLYYGRYGLPDEKKLSLNYLHKSRAYFKTDPKRYATEMYMTGGELVYYYYSKNPDSLDYYFGQVNTLLKDFQKPKAHLWFHVMYGKSLSERGREFESEPHVRKALQIMERYNLKESEHYAGCYELLGWINLVRKQYDQALSYYKTAHAAYLKVNSEYAMKVLDYLAITYERKGDFKNALKIKDQFYKESIALERERNERSLRENELQVDLLTREKELGQKQNQQVIYIIALGIGGMVLLLLYRNFRLKQKSNRKLAAVNNELQNKNHLLDKRNVENELLLKEIHHRVKNNLEVVSGLLALQSAQIDEPNIKEAMTESQNRVNSIGIVHQKLYQGKNLGSIEMKDYFVNLGEGILDTFNAENRVRIECAMDELKIDIDTAVPIGLIVNELLTNALKYAFPNHQRGDIKISLAQTTPNELVLDVHDNGVGKGAEVATRGTGFGTQLIQLLTIQLNGTMEEHFQNGTATHFRFKLKFA